MCIGFGQAHRRRSSSASDSSPHWRASSDGRDGATRSRSTSRRCRRSSGDHERTPRRSGRPCSAATSAILYAVGVAGDLRRRRGRRRAGERSASASAGRGAFAIRPLVVVRDLHDAPPVEAAGVFPQSLWRHSHIRLTREQFEIARALIEAAAGDTAARPSTSEGGAPASRELRPARRRPRDEQQE